MKKIIEQIKNSKNIAIFSHIKTDCDAVCSSLSFKLAVESLGKRADVFIDSKFSHEIEELPYFNCVNNKTIDNYDLYVCLDTATIDRLGKNKYKIMKNRPKSVQLDHHGTNGKYCKYNYINEEKSSTCELLYTFFKMLNVNITPVMAKLLLTGILTDTSRLTYSNTTKDTLYVASKLLEYTNLSMDKVCEPIFSNKTLPEFELNKLVYQKLEFTPDYKIAYVVLNSEDFKKINASFDEVHGLCDIGMAINTVQVVILASQDPVQQDCYHVSIRSKGQISARAIGEAFGGGGHFNAAGCKIFDTHNNTKERLLQAAIKELQC